MSGPGGIAGPASTLTPMFNRADVPPINEQPTGRGAALTIGPILADGTILLPYGDPDANTGPVDVLGWKPGVGLVTFLADFDSERIEYADLGSGLVVGYSIDPKRNLHAHLAAELDGSWKSLDVFVTGVPDAIHLYGFDLTAGVYRVCGSRSPDTAIVWASTDLTTWVEEVAHDGVGTNGFSRFYGFGRSAGRLLVSTVDGSGDYVLDGSTWTLVATQTRDFAPVPPLGPNGERYYSDGYTVYVVT